MSCLKNNEDYERFDKILTKINLNEANKEIIRQRYLTIMKNLKKRTSKYSQMYIVGHTIITVGSLFVPALLSIQYADTGSSKDNISMFQIKIFWSTWIISLLVTIFNGILILFRVDKKYFFLNTIVERIRSEGWQYIGLTGRYSGQYTTETTPTHENQFKLFCYHIEKLKIKQVAEEFFKTDEKSAHNPSYNNTSETNKNNYSITHLPSISSPINSNNDNIPSPVREAVKSLIQSRKIISRNSSPTRQSTISLNSDSEKNTNDDIYEDMNEDINENMNQSTNKIISNLKEYKSDNTVIIVDTKRT